MEEETPVDTSSISAPVTASTAATKGKAKHSGKSEVLGAPITFPKPLVSGVQKLFPKPLVSGAQKPFPNQKVSGMQKLFPKQMVSGTVSVGGPSRTVGPPPETICFGNSFCSSRNLLIREQFLCS
jgi:hypothetical protein